MGEEQCVGTTTSNIGALSELKKPQITEVRIVKVFNGYILYPNYFQSMVFVNLEDALSKMKEILETGEVK